MNLGARGTASSTLRPHHACVVWWPNNLRLVRIQEAVRVRLGLVRMIFSSSTRHRQNQTSDKDKRPFGDVSGDECVVVAPLASIP